MIKPDGHGQIDVRLNLHVDDLCLLDEYRIQLLCPAGVLEYFEGPLEHLPVELDAEGLQLDRLLGYLRLEVEEVSDERAYQLLDHDVLLEEVREKGVFRDDVRET